MLKLEKACFFATSLKSNEVVMEKLLRMSFIKKYPDDLDLLEDVIIENKQAIEMCNIYRDILSGTMDAFASIISNNLNIVMKLLTSLTVIIAIPTLIASLWN
jgi:magnesium transporter